MTNWNRKTREFIELSESQVKFFDEIEEICKKYNLSISHEDTHGSFVIEKHNQSNIDWLKSAILNC